MLSVNQAAEVLGISNVSLYKLIENDGEKVDERFVGFATDITIGGEVKGCLVVEFYNFYENAEQHPLEVDDLKQYLTSDKIKMEYINN